MFIEKGFYYNIKTLELANRVKTIAELYEKYAEKIGDERFDASMKEAKKRAEQIISDSKADKASSTLEAADAKRDNIYKALGVLLKAYTLIPIAADNVLAEPLYATWSKYGAGVTAQSYNEESGNILSLLEDLGKYADKIAALYGVKETIDALTQAQNEFQAANKAFIEATAGEKGKKSASEQKKELNVFFNDKIIRYVNFMIDMGDVKFVDFAKEINVEITKANAAKQAESVSQKPQQPQAVSTNTPQNS